MVLLVVDAVDRAGAGFYERDGFRRATGGGLRLLARVKDLRGAFGA